MSDTPEAPATTSGTPPAAAPQPLPVVRLGITGVFMGLANLVPGVSGGTMVLALGLYEDFINAVSDLTRLRISARPIIVLGMLFGISALTILLLSTVVRGLMEGHLPAMLALFIGMTLGGVPVLWKEVRPVSAPGVVGAVAGFILMALVALVFQPTPGSPGWIMLFVGGIVGSMAMILPGISGSYLLLVLGLYVPIIGGVSDFKDALKAADVSAVMQVGMGVILPVGLGVVIGIVALSNLLQYLLKTHHKPTVGFLLGLLVGSVLGLYPFKEFALDKVGRYAVESESGRELRVRAFGWEPTEASPVWRQLRGVEKGDVRLVIVEQGADTPGVESVTAARVDGSVIIVYDQPLDDAVRREVSRKVEVDGKKLEVELIHVPNTEYSHGRLGLAVLLVFVGFGITLGLGRLKKAGG